jgi:hypothetical protein
MNRIVLQLTEHSRIADYGHLLSIDLPGKCDKCSHERLPHLQATGECLVELDDVGLELEDLLEACVAAPRASRPSTSSTRFAVRASRVSRGASRPAGASDSGDRQPQLTGRRVVGHLLPLTIVSNVEATFERPQPPGRQGRRAKHRTACGSRIFRARQLAVSVFAPTVMGLPLCGVSEGRGGDSERPVPGSSAVANAARRCRISLSRSLLPERLRDSRVGAAVRRVETSVTQRALNLGERLGRAPLGRFPGLAAAPLAVRCVAVLS